MCGIVGIASQSPIADRDVLLEMRKTLRHRGPDDEGAWWSSDGQVGLAQRRLAVIDLSPGGHQPLSDTARNLWLSFNGEIYNYQKLRSELEMRGHRFQTAGDGEVILEAYRAWGMDCVNRLNGMFAFGLYDLGRRRLFLARDRAGEKPLFYHHTNGRLTFASELKALMADSGFPRELDLDALNYYLTYGYVPGQMCLLRGARKLPQGHAMEFNLETGALKVWRYWQLPQPAQPSTATAEELESELEELLLDSVRLRLIADVPVGILLSGGIDSSLVTALAARISSRPIKTYTISFPQHGTYDEAPHARLVARHFATDHTELIAEPASVELLPELAQQYDEPIADSSMVPTYLVSRSIREHATVALGGDGGDELFGGYPHHSWIQREEQLRRIIPGRIRSWAGAAASRILPVGVRGRHHLIGFADGLPQSLAHINMFFDAHSRNRLLAPALRRRPHSGGSPEAYKVRLCTAKRTALQHATALDFMTYLVDDILVKVDRASMLASLEVRAPWLDHRLVEFAFGRVPDRLRATAQQRKVLPRRLARRLLPRALDLTRKQGFSLPLKSWLREQWGGFIKSVLSKVDPQLFDRKMIDDLITAQNRGYMNEHRLFALTMFELWRQSYRIDLPSN